MMKYLYLLLLPLSFLIACQDSSTDTEKETTKNDTSASSEKGVNTQQNASGSPMYIDGWSPNISNEMVYLLKSKHAPAFENWKLAIDSVMTDSTGSFVFSPSVEEGLYALRSKEIANLYGQIYFYLIPGDTLIINPTNDSKTLTMSGSAGQRNMYQWESHLRFFKYSEIRQKLNDSKTYPKDTFVNFVQNRRKEGHDFMKEYFKDQEIPSVYSDYLKAKIDFAWVNRISHYQQYHIYYTQQKWRYFPYDSLGIDYLNDEGLKNTCCPFSREYANAIGSLMEEHYQRGRDPKIADSIHFDQLLDKRFDIAKEHFTKEARDIALVNVSKQFFLSMAEDNFFDKLEEINSYFKTNKTNDHFYHFFEQQYESLKAIAPGETAPNFTLPNPADKPVSLSDFKGKVVYIDFWGTWCGPCIAAMPKLVKLEKQLEGEDVVFLMVALEYNEGNVANWKKYLQDKNVPGTHVVAEKQFKNKEIVPYLISAAPSYVLIDKEGNIVKTRAKSPDKVEADIRALL